jgi:hypothetical protein
VAAHGGPALVTQPYAYCVVVVDLKRLCQSLHQNNPASVKQRADCAWRGTSIITFCCPKLRTCCGDRGG